VASADTTVMSLRRVLGVIVLTACLSACAQDAQNAVDDMGQAQDRAAEYELRNAAAAAKTFFVGSASYAGADESPSGLVSVEPALCYVGHATASVATGATCASGSGSTSVSVLSEGDSTWAAAVMSASGTCFYLKDSTTGGTTYGSDPSGANCTGDAALVGATSAELTS
jgi:hypothetical protein